MQSRLLVAFLLGLSLLWIVTSVDAQMTSVDITGGTSYIGSGEKGIVYAFPIYITFPGLVSAIGVNWAGTVVGGVAVALYNSNYPERSDRPSHLFTDSGNIFIDTSGGWQDIPVALKSVTYGHYWVAIQISSSESVFAIASTRAYYYKEFGSFNSSWPHSNYAFDYAGQWNMRLIYLVHFPTLPLEQQNQINALPASPHPGSYWNRIKTERGLNITQY